MERGKAVAGVLEELQGIRAEIGRLAEAMTGRAGGSAGAGLSPGGRENHPTAKGVFKSAVGLLEHLPMGRAAAEGLRKAENIKGHLADLGLISPKHGNFMAEMLAKLGVPAAKAAVAGEQKDQPAGASIRPASTFLPVSKPAMSGPPGIAAAQAVRPVAASGSPVAAPVMPKSASSSGSPLSPLRPPSAGDSSLGSAFGQLLAGLKQLGGVGDAARRDGEQDEQVELLERIAAGVEALVKHVSHTHGGTGLGNAGGRSPADKLAAFKPSAPSVRVRGRGHGGAGGKGNSGADMGKVMEALPKILEMLPK